MSYTPAQVLLDSGFSEKEAQIYLTLLELGSANAAVVARRTNIKRVTVYAVLHELIRKGIAKSISKKGVRYFQVIDAPKLLQRQQRHLSAFEHLLPEFVALSDKYENKPSVEYFEGVAGLKRLYEDTLTSSTPLKAFMGKQTTVDDDMLAYLYDEYMPQRVAAGIQAYVIVCDAAENQAYCDADDQQWLKETLMISHAVFSLANEINLYNGNKVSVALYTADELSGILITSNHLYDTLVSIFDLLRVSFHDPK